MKKAGCFTAARLFASVEKTEATLRTYKVAYFLCYGATASIAKLEKILPLQATLFRQIGIETIHRDPV